MYAQIRHFFQENAVLEVETPVFSQAGNTDPFIHSLVANFASSDERTQYRYAQTSPEFAMKRLLSEGLGSIYQICKVFRVEEVGRLHNPEFSMLEWYRPELNYRQLMDEIACLLELLGIAEVCNRVNYKALFQRFLGIDVFAASVGDLKRCAAHHHIDIVGELDSHNGWCDLLMSHLIEPKLKSEGALFVYDYPSSQAALANVRFGEQPGDNDVAERFELYIDGVEIANGYQELTNPDEYRRRFNAENQLRRQHGQEALPLDENLLSAMSKGFPECAGVAMGLDRLLMCQLGIDDIQRVMTFDFHRA